MNMKPLNGSWQEQTAMEAAYNNERDKNNPNLRECDCCGEMKPDTRAVYIPTVGDTVFCEDCSR